MPRMDRLSSYRTTISADEKSGEVVVTYVRTAIVRFDAKRVVLDSASWRTVTTKRKMNQAANQFGLPYRVFQEQHEWFVRLFDEPAPYHWDRGRTVDFEDGMVIPR